MFKKIVDRLRGEKALPVSIVARGVAKRQKALVLLTVGLLGFIALLFILVKKPAPRVARVRTNAIHIDAKSDDEDNWHVQSGSQLASLDSRAKAQAHQAAVQHQAVALLERRLKAQALNMQTLQHHLDAMDTQLTHGQQHFQTQVSAAINGIAKQVGSTTNPRGATGGNGSTGAGASGTPSAPARTLAPVLTVFSPPAAASPKKGSVKRVPNPYHGYLPMGSFFKATLLNGVVAPTGSNGAANPVPILMKVMSDAILPNDRYHYQVRGCFIMGVASGSLSSERVDIKISRISCISPSGAALISSPIKGFIVDDDGKAALRGKLINRQGSKLGKAMLAGFAQGIGQMFGNAQGTSVITPGGTGISIGTNQKLRGAGFNGIGQAANTAAQFYIKQAEQIFPVIVINAGRNITIDIAKGVQLQWLDMQDRTVLPSQLARTHAA